MPLFPAFVIQSKIIEGLMVEFLSEYQALKVPPGESQQVLPAATAEFQDWLVALFQEQQRVWEPRLVLRVSRWVVLMLT